MGRAGTGEGCVESKRGKEESGKDQEKEKNQERNNIVRGPKGCAT